VVPADVVFHHRNKLEYSCTQTPSGPALGFHKAGRWDEVLDIRRCWLTTDLGNAIREAVREWAQAAQLEPYDQAEQTGFLRHLVVREGRNTGQALVQLATAPGERARSRASPGKRACTTSTAASARSASPSRVTHLPCGESRPRRSLSPARSRTPS